MSGGGVGERACVCGKREGGGERKEVIRQLTGWAGRAERRDTLGDVS